MLTFKGARDLVVRRWSCQGRRVSAGWWILVVWLRNGEFSLELRELSIILPELQKPIFVGSGAIDDAFTPFIDSRKNAGHPRLV